MTMAVGGLALHWGGACNRFSEEDLRLKSMYGLATDWPIEWAELERYYVRGRAAAERQRRAESASRRIGARAPYPQGPIPLSYNLQMLKTWAEQSGLKFSRAADGAQPDAVRRPRRLLRLRHVRRGLSVGRALFARLHVPAADRAEEDRAARSHAGPPARPRRRSGRRSSPRRRVHQDRPDEPIEYRAKTFVVASGYCWSSHLLLLSANSRFPNGLANSSGLVGRYMNGHSFIQATANIDDQTFPGQNMTHSLISREYFRCPADKPFVRHDTRVWESSAGRDPRLRAPDGKLLLGDELMADWRSRTKGSSVRLRAYVDVHPSADSRLTLDASKKNRYGDPMPKIEHRFDEATLARAGGDEGARARRVRHAREGEQRPHRQHERRRLSRSSRRRLPDGRRSGDQRLRQLRPHARSREPLRRRRADDADRRLHERHADVRRADAALGRARSREIRSAKASAERSGLYAARRL